MGNLTLLPQTETTDLIGKRIRLIEMVDEIEPIENGAEGTIYHVGGGVINVKWDGGRNLGVIADVDKYEILD